VEPTRPKARVRDVSKEPDGVCACVGGREGGSGKRLLADASNLPSRPSVGV
jgi:hypothetical protein